MKESERENDVTGKLLKVKASDEMKRENVKDKESKKRKSDKSEK